MAEPDKTESAEQSNASSDLSAENEKIGEFGGEYTFDYHYAQTPDSFFYVKAFIVGDEDDGAVRVSKSDFADKVLIASQRN